MERLSFVDWARVCIWGWSFGGYLAAMALAEDARTNRQALVDKTGSHSSPLKLSKYEFKKKGSKKPKGTNTFKK